MGEPIKSRCVPSLGALHQDNFLFLRLWRHQVMVHSDRKTRPTAKTDASLKEILRLWQAIAGRLPNVTRQDFDFLKER